MDDIQVPSAEWSGVGSGDGELLRVSSMDDIQVPSAEWSGVGSGDGELLRVGSRSPMLKFMEPNHLVSRHCTEVHVYFFPSQILELPSKLFYKNKLTCKAVFPMTGPKDIPAIKFIGVDGREMQEEDSPSYSNLHESIKIAEQVLHT